MKERNISDAVVRVLRFFRQHNGGELFVQSVVTVGKCIELGNDFAVSAASLGISNKYPAETILKALKTGAGEEIMEQKEGNEIVLFPTPKYPRGVIDGHASTFYYKESS